jgi:hypothetical protein
MGRTTLGLVVVFLALAAGVVILEKVQPRTPESQTVYVVDVKDTDVQRIDLRTPAGEAAFERADPLGWKFASSGADADLSRVSSVVNRLAKLRSSAKVEKPGELSQYGLEPALETAVLTMKDGTTTRIRIGSKTANDAAHYATAEGKGEVHTINTLLVGDVEKLVTQPPVPSPTAGPAPTSTPRGGAATPQPTVEADETPTIGLPAPAVTAP